MCTLTTSRDNFANISFHSPFTFIVFECCIFFATKLVSLDSALDDALCRHSIIGIIKTFYPQNIWFKVTTDYTVFRLRHETYMPPS